MKQKALTPCLPTCAPGRHDPVCPNSRAGTRSRSGPSGRSKRPMTLVESRRIEALREVLGLPGVSANAAILAAIERLKNS